MCGLSLFCRPRRSSLATMPLSRRRYPHRQREQHLLRNARVQYFDRAKQYAEILSSLYGFLCSALVLSAFVCPFVLTFSEHSLCVPTTTPPMTPTSTFTAISIQGPNLPVHSALPFHRWDSQSTVCVLLHCWEQSEPEPPQPLCYLDTGSVISTLGCIFLRLLLPLFELVAVKAIIARKNSLLSLRCHHCETEYGLHCSGILQEYSRYPPTKVFDQPSPSSRPKDHKEYYHSIAACLADLSLHLWMDPRPSHLCFKPSSTCINVSVRGSACKGINIGMLPSTRSYSCS